MKNGLFKKWLSAVLCVLVLGSTAALAEPDTFGLGTGRNGARTVSTAGTLINSYAPVTGPLAAGDTLIPVGTCTGEAVCFAAGDLVLVLQMTGLVPEPASGDTTLLDLNSKYKEVGRWELARLASVTVTELTLTAPLVHGYAANVTQVIRVPEYTSLTLDSSITAPKWNGSTGGVIAFLAQDTFTNNSTVNANAIGFRGGRFVDDNVSSTACLPAELDEAAPKGAQKGEGLASTRYGDTHTGRGNVANGGGGGVCARSGGGGGGNGGSGGQGGNSEDGNRPVGGLGGAAVDGTFLSRLTLGGGGGAGHGSAGSNVAGGQGGGIVFIRANQLTGTGSILANGESAGVAASDASSGGGAGGTLYLRFATSASCNTANSLGARGGIGGNSGLGQVGPGGGGGGGRILFQSSGGTCSLGLGNVSGATAGTQQDPGAPGGSNYGAQAGSVGVFSRLNTGFPTALPVPTVITPADGSVTSNRRPFITGSAQPNSTVVIYLDGVELGRATANAAGDYVFTPPADLAERSYSVQAAIEVEGVQSLKSTANTFTVDVTQPVAPVVSTPANGAVLTTPRPAITGTAEAGSTVTVIIDGVAVGTVTADASGNWSYTPATALADGLHSVKATARDAAGNTSPESNVRDFIVDTTAPAAPVVTAPGEGEMVGTQTPVLSGTAEPHSTVTVIIDGQVVGTVPADAAGNWSYTPTAPLTPGSHEVRVRTTDEAGNSSPTSEPRTFTVVLPDTSAPETNITSGPSGTTPERSATFELGSNEAGVTFECSLDGAAYTPCTSPVTFTDLAEGEHTLQVRARDAAGNVDATPATRTWTVSADTGNTDGDIAFLGDGLGCSATGGDASLLLLGLGTFLTLARRRRRS